MSAGIVVLVGGGAPSAQQGMMFGGAQLKPLARTGPLQLSKKRLDAGSVSASLQSLLESTQAPRKNVRARRRKKKILPLIQYRAPPPAGPKPAGGPRRRRPRPVVEDDASTADPFAQRQAEPLSQPKHAMHWSAMLRGEQSTSAAQAITFKDMENPAGWAARDEQHAIQCRQKAYAEAAEARRADDAVNAYKRDIELRRRQREVQQKAQDDEDKAKKEVDLRTAAARKRALPKKRRLRPELSPLKAGQTKSVTIEEPPKKRVVDVTKETDLWDAILNEDAIDAPALPVKRPASRGHISPEKSKEMARPMRDVVREQKLRWKKRRDCEKKFLKQQVAKARRDLDKRAHVRVDARPLQGNSNLVKEHQGSLMPGFDASGHFKDDEDVEIQDGVRPMTGKKISRRYGQNWLEEHFKSLVGGGGVVAFAGAEVEEPEEAFNDARPYTASLLANRPSTTASQSSRRSRNATSPISLDDGEAKAETPSRKRDAGDTRRARFAEFKDTGVVDGGGSVVSAVSFAGDVAFPAAPEPAADALVAAAPSEEPVDQVGDRTLNALEERLRTIFDRVDSSGDGEISVMEAVKALRKDDEFAEVLGFDEATRVRQEDGTKDRLVLALGALDSDGDKKVSWDEFRRAALGETTAPATPQKITGFAVGSRIEALYENGDKWYAGIVEAVHDNAYDVRYDDGDREYKVKAALVRREGPDSKPKTPQVAAKTPATAASDDYGDDYDDFEEPPSTQKKASRVAEPDANVAALEAYLRRVFERVDASGDGHISVEEAVGALRDDEDFSEILGVESSRDDVLEAIQGIDADGDSRISWAEFRRAALGEAEDTAGDADARKIDFPEPEPSAEAVAAREAEEAERTEAARLETERLETERVAAEEKREAARRCASADEKGRLLAKAKAERAAKQEAARKEAAEQAEVTRVEAERLAALKAEEDRVAAEQAEAARIEGERLKAIKAEEARVEKERIETERLERERVKAEEAARAERKREEATQLAAERAAMEERTKLQAAQMDAALRALEAKSAPAPPTPTPLATSTKLEPPTPGTDYGDDDFEGSAATPGYGDSFEAAASFDAPATPQNVPPPIPEHAAAAAAPVPELPSGWVELIDPDSGAAYYLREEDGQSAWERPGAEAAPTPPARPKSPEATPFSRGSTGGYGEDDDFEEEDFADFEG